MRPLATVMSLLLCCHHIAALGRVVSYDELPFSTVTALYTCGNWKVDGRDGQFRVIQAYLYGGTMLFVDMISANKRGTWLVTESGFTFPELNDDHLEYELSEVRCVSLDINKITVTGHVTEYEGGQFTFRLEIDGSMGSYEFTRTAYE